MKSLPVKSPHYQYIEKGFGAWLDTLGYGEAAVYNMPNIIRGLLHYLEQKGCTSVPQISTELMRSWYYSHVRNRPNKLRDGGLSAAHLNKHIQALDRFCDYLRQSGRLMLPSLNIRHEPKPEPAPEWFTEEEIKQLYAACDMYTIYNRKAEWISPALALRDKAMLAVYYGCGLRLNEGVHVELNDIRFTKQILHVRKGKNYKERFVPVSKASIKHIENYVYDARPLLLREHKCERLFITERGTVAKGQALRSRLENLIARTENITLMEKEASMHTLRHSIATHLHARGMSIERVKDFLGHDSLESTQIYTHLVEQEMKRNNGL